jgi:hypothetical protein
MRLRSIVSIKQTEEEETMEKSVSDALETVFRESQGGDCTCCECQDGGEKKHCDATRWIGNALLDPSSGDMQRQEAEEALIKIATSHYHEKPRRSAWHFLSEAKSSLGSAALNAMQKMESDPRCSRFIAEAGLLSQ